MKHNPQNHFIVPPAIKGAQQIIVTGNDIFVKHRDGVERKLVSYSSNRRAQKEAIGWQKSFNEMHKISSLLF